jgi:transcriptional regulator with XRE-family HTH domain
MPAATTPAVLRTPEGVRAWRKERGLSQIELAELLEVVPLTVLRWENGQVAIPRTVELALRYLDATTEEWM